MGKQERGKRVAFNRGTEMGKQERGKRVAFNNKTSTVFLDSFSSSLIHMHI